MKHFVFAKAFGISAIAALLPAGPSFSANPTFGPTVVDSVRLLVGGDGATTVFDDSSILSSGGLCARIYADKPSFEAALNEKVAKINDDLPVPGVNLVRTRLDLSANCAAFADASLIGSSDPRLLVHARLLGNTFSANVTTPDLDIFGGLGLPQGADPRFSVTFNLDVSFVVDVPTRTSEAVTISSSTVSMYGIGLPTGENFTGDAIAAIGAAASEVYDLFSGGELSSALQEGQTFEDVLPSNAFSPLNALLSQSSAQFPFLSAFVYPANVLTLHATVDGVIVNANCIPGYVWREARRGDRVCVTVEPDVRRQTREENRLAAERRDGLIDWDVVSACLDGDCAVDAFRIPCKPGFVWREAFENDYVCVDPRSRDQAREDNAWERRRRLDYEPYIH